MPDYLLSSPGSHVARVAKNSSKEILFLFRRGYQPSLFYSVKLPLWDRKLDGEDDLLSGCSVAWQTIGLFIASLGD